MSVGSIGDELPISLPAISKHLRILEQVDLVRVRREGRFRLYRLHATPLREVETWIAHYSHFWDDRLTNLKSNIEEQRNQRD